jgi:hypothetical protein
VEQKDFIEFCETLRSEYPVPTHNTVKNRILCKWEDEKCKVRQMLENGLHGKTRLNDYRYVDIFRQARIHVHYSPLYRRRMGDALGHHWVQARHVPTYW